MSYALKLVSSYFRALSISANHNKHLDASPATDRIIFWLIFESLEEVFGTLSLDLIHTANRHGHDSLQSQIYSHIMHLSADFHNKKRWPAIQGSKPLHPPTFGRNRVDVIHIRQLLSGCNTYST